jgi:hypothetical protein
MGDIVTVLLTALTDESRSKRSRRACEENGKLYFLPCATMADRAYFPGVYDTITKKSINEQRDVLIFSEVSTTIDKQY